MGEKQPGRFGYLQGNEPRTPEEVPLVKEFEELMGCLGQIGILEE